MGGEAKSGTWRSQSDPAMAGKKNRISHTQKAWWRKKVEKKGGFMVDSWLIHGGFMVGSC